MSAGLNDHQSRAHSKIGPSAHDRWSNCPGSVRMSEGIEPKSSIYADEGTAAHELAEWCLLNGKLPGEHPTGEITVNGTVFPVTDEMIDAVEEYVLPISKFASQPERYVVMVEQRFHLKDIHPKLFGTCDAIIYDRETRTLNVRDLKYGSGVAVDVIENTQLMIYGLGAMLSMSKDPVDRVVLTIVQPRCFHPDGSTRSWETSALDLAEWSVALAEQAYATDAEDAALNPGEWCRWCPAAGKCPKLQQAAIESAQNVFDIPEPGAQYSPLSLAEALDRVPLVKAWCEAVTEFAYEEAQHGRLAPGYKLVDKIARKKWRDESAARTWCKSKGLPEEEYLNVSMITPTQLMKRVGKTAAGELKELIVAESSGTVLVHESDRRPAVKTDAAAVFAAN